MTDLIERLRSLAEACPDNVFGTVTDSDRETAPGAVQRGAAQMGRHFSPLFCEAADEIERLRRNGERYEFLRDKCNHVVRGVHIQFSSTEQDADDAIDAVMKGANAGVNPRREAVSD